MTLTETPKSVCTKEPVDDCVKDMVGKLEYAIIYSTKAEIVPFRLAFESLDLKSTNFMMLNWRCNGSHADRSKSVSVDKYVCLYVYLSQKIDRFIHVRLTCPPFS